MTNNSVLQDWVIELPFQQQSVLMSALRGPDGVAKYHPMKQVVRAYRASVIKAADGRAMQAADISDSFMDIGPLFDVPVKTNAGFTVTGRTWNDCVKDYYDHVDELPLHYHLHMLHGAQIIGYNHPTKTIHYRWQHFYKQGVDDMHLKFENRAEMDERLNDFGLSPGGTNGHKEV